MSMPPDLNTGVRDTKTEPITAQLAILLSPCLCLELTTVNSAVVKA